MASLDKLAIRGIRSFDDKQISVIEFFNPVTVIVGHNGSGKTTIIECLKYATTGDQPPNTRGGAFVHDPKMANEKEVKAQVKLRFYAANHQRMLAVRNLSVTMKKTGALTMKTLESILALADEQKGKRGAISTKCAEMDAEIPHLLGVSKAVLENVIFCHQEDSYWPLAEPSILKKKFDDIFEATKYTKALDSIKALRKDRVAELKAEKERLESLSKEKAHADKLKGRVTDLSSTIASKEMEYDELKKEYERLVTANARFYESATKFREIYLKADTLNDKKTRYQEELEDARENVRELEGTDQELANRLKNFDDHVHQQKQRRQREMGNLDGVVEELAAVRKTHVALISEQGQLAAEEKAQEQLIRDREGLIREISIKHQLKGYDHTPLERDKILEFINRLSELRQRQNSDTDKLQEEYRTKSEEYNAKSRRLHADLESHKQQRSQARERITNTQTRVTQAESELDKAGVLTSQLRTLQTDMEEKTRRIESTKTDIRNGNFDQRLADANAKGRSMESRRDELTTEIRTLSLQADARARLELKRADIMSKSNELTNTMDVNSSKFRRLVGVDARPDTMEQEIECVAVERERELLELENQSNIANRELQTVEASLSNLKAQLDAKQKEIKGLDRKIALGLKEDDLNYASVEAGLEDVTTELDTRKSDMASSANTQVLYRHLLRLGLSKRCCPLCTRSMDEQEAGVYEKTVGNFISRTDPAVLQDVAEEIQEWEGVLKKLQRLRDDAAARDHLKNSEVPSLEEQVKGLEEQCPLLAEKAEEALQRFNEAKKQIKEINTLRQHAASVTQIQKDLERLNREVSAIEADLSSTGSTKTVDDLQVELDTLSSDMRAIDREKQNLMSERDRLTNGLRLHESELGTMRVQESDLKSEIREKTALEGRIEEWKAEIANSSAQIKDLDGKITNAQGPIDRLDQAFHEAQRVLSANIVQAQQAAQALNMSADKMDNINKTIERYVRGKRGPLLRECNEKIERHESEIQQLGLQVEDIRNSIQVIDKEISESGASVANLRENLRIRRLRQDIDAAQAEIESLDLEEAAKAKRIFDDKYNTEKERETRVQSKYAHIGGEISSLKSQLKTLQNDQGDFRDVGKRYRDQLIRVKMSDMANNDLEKYAKALDNAIMKYHSLKMEEVNDTMRHLWNKTYQGTDIDGIKISSEGEGGATKRSYNYRVVMTKDQVEMDMRGRCSAGQKMLASIIIRLALADSFGQNCGILALDEPTNALDTENIDALAASLVDIINERKSNSSFQLIIITHDENFLRKLGQSNVMEYYWRVSRDARQKSIIERHRFG